MTPLSKCISSKPLFTGGGGGGGGREREGAILTRKRLISRGICGRERGEESGRTVTFLMIF